MAIRNIRKIGDSVLNKVSKEVKVVDEKLNVLIDDMIETMYEAEGVGLAAPQVGVLKRLVVIDVSEEGNDPIFNVSRNNVTGKRINNLAGPHARIPFFELSFLLNFACSSTRSSSSDQS